MALNDCSLPDLQLKGKLVASLSGVLEGPSTWLSLTFTNPLPSANQLPPSRFEAKAPHIYPFSILFICSLCSGTEELLLRVISKEPDLKKHLERKDLNEDHPDNQETKRSRLNGCGSCFSQTPPSTYNFCRKRLLQNLLQRMFLLVYHNRKCKPKQNSEGHYL